MNTLTFSSMTIGSQLNVIGWNYDGHSLKARYKIGDRIGSLEYVNSDLCKALQNNGTIASYKQGLVSWLLTENDGEISTLSKFMGRFSPHIESFVKWSEYWANLKAEFNLRKGAMETAVQNMSKVQ